MIEPLSPIVHIWIEQRALTAWAEGNRLPDRRQVLLQSTGLPHYIMISIRYKTYCDLLAHFEELSNRDNDLPF
jgi:hypothetical protein